VSGYEGIEMKRRSLAYAALALASVAALPVRAAPRDRVEQPKFTELAQFDDFEVRRYGSRLEAVVTVRARNAREASNEGFRILAAFIFGNNESRSEIEMTAPVGRSQEIEMTAPVGRVRQGNAWTISFTMPSEWRVDTLPQPKDSRVVIREVPEESYAVMRFRGSPGEETLAKREIELREAARKRGFEPRPSASIYNRYDPPWIPPLLRRNELWVAVDGQAR
jgi:hypothetical protein